MEDASQDALKAQIVDDVKRVAAPRLATVPHSKAALTDAIPGVVQLSLDFAVRLGGPAISALVDSEHDLIRKFVSAETLKWVESMCHGLEAVKTEAADNPGN
jgi:hypothetical protein